MSAPWRRILLASGLLAWATVAALAQEKVAVLADTKSKLNTGVIEVIKDNLKGVEFKWELFIGVKGRPGPGERQQAKEWLDAINQNAEVSLVITLGRFSSYMAAKHVRRKPVLFSMVSHPKYYRLERPNVAGLVALPDLACQIKSFKELGRNEVTVLYLKNYQHDLVRRGKEFARKHGVRLDLKGVKTRREIPAVLRNLRSRALILVPDPRSQFLEGRVLRFIALNCLKRKILLMVPTAAYRNFGLFWLNTDWSVVGKKIAALARKILGGVAPANLPREYLPPGTLEFNPRYSRQVAVRFTKRLLAGPRSWCPR